jgi:poly-gamma-glutamate synthesis protein (capsule biosynthesis protein)
LTPGEPTHTPFTPYLWIASAAPKSLRESALASGMQLATVPEMASARLDVLNPQASTENSLSSTWFYALVTPFPTIVDGVSLADIQSAWSGNSGGPFAGRPLWMEESTLAAFSSLWGSPATGAVSVSPADTLVDSAWEQSPAWAIVPFEALEPRWKVLSVDGQSPVHNDFDPAAYPLKIVFSLQPSAFSLPATNRDPNQLTVLAMTGVTALVRATADKMEKKGVLYPGEEIRGVLRSADITHVSNEIPFDADCPKPDPWTESLRFCSDPAYIALLEDVGVDIVELSGNHMMDYGSAALLYTLDMYTRRGWQYFAGGRDLEESLQPAKIAHNGNKLAFIGCNYAGPPSDWATEASPGSAPCDFDQMHAEITSLRADGYLPIVTFQYNEYYQPNPTDYEQRDFRSMVEAGAVIVSGSQAHVPAAMEFDNNAFIHYGLGNLFFDQMAHLMPDGSTIYDTRNVFVDRHIFYGGRYIGTELLSYIIEDYARPRLMTEPERTHFLQYIFNAAGW